MSKKIENTLPSSGAINFNNIKSLYDLFSALSGPENNVIQIEGLDPDSKISLSKVSRACLIISKERGKNNPSIKSDALDLLKHCAGEVLEVGNARDVYIAAKKNGQSMDKVLRAFNNYSEEIADVIICALLIAVIDGVNIEASLLEKINKNFLRAKKIGDKY